uniref:BTB domain-containing protein n=1 Tax=Panagrolaimus sp. ES5 TaxID=591445 RepID=A0AC34F368_9BILA
MHMSGHEEFPMLCFQANECLIGMKWRIKEEKLKSRKPVKSLKSKRFKANIPGVKYYLKLHPNGRNERDKNNVRVSCYLVFGMTKTINASFTISVKSASRNFKISCIFEKSNGRGNVLCTHEELVNPENKFFVDGILEVELDGKLTSHGLKRKAPESLSLAQLLLESDEDKDITIVVKNQEIKVHKLVLCVCSSVFRAELNSDFKEAKENKIEITDFLFEIVQIAIDFFYEKDIKEQINEKNSTELLRFSDKYNVKLLHDFMQTYLIEKLCECNVVEFANSSIISNAQDLREYSICFLLNLAGKSITIDGIEELEEEIKKELFQRSFLSASK